MRKSSPSWTTPYSFMCKPASDLPSIHTHRLIKPLRTHLSISVAARSKEWVCGRSLAGISGSNPVGGMEVCLLWVLCVVRCLCDELIIGTEEFYRVWWGNPDPLGVDAQWKENLTVSLPACLLSIYISLLSFSVLYVQPITNYEVYFCVI